MVGALKIGSLKEDNMIMHMHIDGAAEFS